MLQASCYLTTVWEKLGLNSHFVFFERHEPATSEDTWGWAKLVAKFVDWLNFFPSQHTLLSTLSLWQQGATQTPPQILPSADRNSHFSVQTEQPWWEDHLQLWISSSSVPCGTEGCLLQGTSREQPSLAWETVWASASGVGSKVLIIYCL